MLCVEHLLSASTQTACMTPWTWWDHLSETDQATWFGAWSAAAAFLGGLAIYAHGKSREWRARVASRRAQAVKIASLLPGPIEKLERLMAWRTSPPTGGVPLRTLEIPAIEQLEGLMTDPSAFEGDEAAEFLLFLAELRRRNRHFYEASAGEGDQATVSVDAIDQDIGTVCERAKQLSERMWTIAAVGHVPDAQKRE